jgi:hypothetical protein
MRATSHLLIAMQSAAEATLLWWRFTYSTLSLWNSLIILQGPKENSPQSPEGLEIQMSQSFKRVGINREGKCLPLSLIIQLMVVQSVMFNPGF